MASPAPLCLVQWVLIQGLTTELSKHRVAARTLQEECHYVSVVGSHVFGQRYCLSCQIVFDILVSDFILLFFIIRSNNFN